MYNQWQENKCSYVEKRNVLCRHVICRSLMYVSGNKCFSQNGELRVGATCISNGLPNYLSFGLDFDIRLTWACVEGFESKRVFLKRLEPLTWSTSQILELFLKDFWLALDLSQLTVNLEVIWSCLNSLNIVYLVTWAKVKTGWLDTSRCP